MRAHILQHTSFTGAGNVYDYLKQNDFSHTLTRFFAKEPLPGIDTFDWLFICGGEMGAYEEQKHPWLKLEKQFIESAMAAGKRVTGLCLGSQLIASVCGATVEKNKHWEAGWWPVQLENEKKLLTVFQYHQDTFHMPKGAERIATNEACANQAYRLGKKVFATQFHPEATEEWIVECAKEEDYPFGKSKYVQDPKLVTNRADLLKGQREWFFSQLERQRVES